MGDKDWWETFKKTGSVEDYLACKGYTESEKREAGESTLESVNQCDRDDTVRSTYR